MDMKLIKTRRELYFSARSEECFILIPFRKRFLISFITECKINHNRILRNTKATLTEATANLVFYLRCITCIFKRFDKRRDLVKTMRDRA